MSEPDPSGYGESPNTADGQVGEDMVDGTPGNDRSDGGERDVPLTTDDEAQRDDLPARPGNAAS